MLCPASQPFLSTSFSSLSVCLSLFSVSSAFLPATVSILPAYKPTGLSNSQTHRQRERRTHARVRRSNISICKFNLDILQGRYQRSSPASVSFRNALLLFLSIEPPLYLSLRLWDCSLIAPLVHSFLSSSSPTCLPLTFYLIYSYKNRTAQSPLPFSQRKEIACAIYTRFSPL